MTGSPGATARELASLCGGRLVDEAGRGDCVVRRISTLEEATADSITWVTDRPHAARLGECPAAVVMGPAEFVSGDRRGLIVGDAEAALSVVLERFRPATRGPGVGIHASAVVAGTARLGPGVRVGACAVVGEDAEIGDGTVIWDGVSVGAGVRMGKQCVLHPRCVVYERCELGDRVIVHGGTVIGADGFGYIFRDGVHRKIPHIGRVVIEDDVEIGACTCIDRGKWGDTRIGRGAKIDNLVQLAHNVRIGPLCILAAQCGISGSVRIGAGAVFGGRAGSIHSVTVGDGVRVAATSVLWSDVPAGGEVLGNPAQDRGTELRIMARNRMLPDLFERVRDLARRVQRLDSATNHPGTD